jgi:ankyrin repeat protein
MKNIENIFLNEDWNGFLETITENKDIISTIDPADLAWKRFQYQLSENGKIDLLPPFGNFTELLKVIEYCKSNGLLGLTIPQATAFQQFEQIKYLLSQGHNIDEQEFGETTGLLIASALNDYNLVKFFIDNGAFVSFFDQENFEAIDLTVSSDIIQLLKRYGGKTKQQRQQDYDEYCDAREKLNILREINLSFIKGAEEGNIKQMEEALQKSSMDFLTLNFAYPVNGWTALHYAVKNNDKTVFDFLINKGIDAAKKNLDGLTAMELANKLGHIELLS